MKRLITILSTAAFALSATFAETPTPAASDLKPTTKVAEFFKELDTDGDGVLNMGEFKSGLSAKNNSTAVEEYFTKLDTNGDGNVSLAEYISHNKQSETLAPQAEPSAQLPPPAEKKKSPTSSEPAPKSEQPQNQPPKTSEPQAKASSSSAEAYFKKMDINDDGGISLIEFKASPAGQNNPRMAGEYFKNLDKNGDNKITFEEMTARRTQSKSAIPASDSEKPSTSLSTPNLDDPAYDKRTEWKRRHRKK